MRVHDLLEKEWAVSKCWMNFTSAKITEWEWSWDQIHHLTSEHGPLSYHGIASWKDLEDEMGMGLVSG